MSGLILDLWSGALQTVMLVGAPFVVAALAVGLLTSLIQAMTQLQDTALSFVPKVLATGLVLALAGNWVLAHLVRYFTTAFQGAATIGGGGGP